MFGKPKGPSILDRLASAEAAIASLAKEVADAKMDDTAAVATRTKYEVTALRERMDTIEHDAQAMTSVVAALREAVGEEAAKPTPEQAVERVEAILEGADGVE